MKEVVIYRAADAFLYLPTYIAEHANIFRTKEPNFNVSFETAETWGDPIAIQNVIDVSKDPSRIPIALCDPLAIFPRDGSDEPENLRIIGTLIDKPPLWAVSTATDIEFETMEDVAAYFSHIVYYINDELITGHYIGETMKNKSDLRGAAGVGFGEEIESLLKQQAEVKKENPDYKCVAVTVNIIQLAQKQDSKVYLNYRFSKNEEFDKFLTTCLITTAEVCEKHPGILKDILEGIQRSILILRTSKKIAEDVCQIVVSQTESNLSEGDITWIVKQLHKEDFYPDNLITPEENWKSSIDARAWFRIWKEDKKDELKEKYNTIVNNEFAEQAQDSIIEQVSGISMEDMKKNLDTHKKEMKEDMKKNLDTHKKEMKEDMKKNLDTHTGKMEKHHRVTTAFLLGSTFLLLLLFFWFPDLTGKLGLNKYEQMIRISLSGLFGLVFIFKIVFWNRNWSYICAAAGGVTILVIAGYFFGGLVISVINGVVSSLISTLILRKIERNSDK